jgi:mono/diheme cytochrome c family protein
MSNTTRRRRVMLLVLAAIPLSLLAVLFLRRQGYSQTERTKNEATRLIHSVEGPDLFKAYCASCHGVKARGNGPAAAGLKVKVPDLTGIGKRNGGKFPADRMREIIAGEDRIAAHGSQAMPVWGPIFHQVEADQDWGQVRLENLTKYLASIQQQ